jgi:hypothetical protein
MLGEEHPLRYHQDWSYLDDAGIDEGVDNQTLETASGCPLWVALVEEGGSHLGMRAMNLGLNRSCSMALEEARQNLGEHSWDWKLAVAEMGDPMVEGEVEEVLDLSMDPWDHGDREGESDEVEEEVVVLFQIPGTLSFADPA